MAGIYIHIPFCKQACSYCDFYFVTRTGTREPYVERLLEEIESYRETRYVQEPVKTVYFGGGTPSLLMPGQIGRIMDKLRSVFRVRPEEVTLEMNPDDVTREYLSALRDIGITRASMGVQSFQPELLELMHRAHNREEALGCLELLSVSGFDVFTVDIIYGNPGQSPDQLDRDLDLLLEFNPPHVSAYSLTIEPRTRLGKQVELGRIDPPPDDLVANHFDILVDRLSGEGLGQYEVSNYSKPGCEAIHNSRYWRHENYLGLGPAAHSFWWEDDAVRWENPADIKAYLEQPFENLREVETEILDEDQLAEERLMLGLRTREGITVSEMNRRYQYEFSDRQAGYMENKTGEGKAFFDGETFRLTREGLKIADAIILDIITM